MSFSLQSAIDEMFKPPSRLQTLIDRAVGLERDGPDLALNLDICELVNTKKGNYPHDSVTALLPYINGRSQRQAQLALTLLDNLVKNCGHPVHFQVASREFLNELFRRFPEYQPAMPNPVHYRILEMLQEWQLTLCRRSRYKEDLQRINDMYSLLRRKGWRFPDVEEENIAVVFGPEDALKSPEELEKEDLEAMQAKLQELLRRATPRDLREANKLMKIITGYEQSSKKPDYDREWKSELDSIEHKATLLVEILQNTKPGDWIDESTRDLLAKCVSNQSRIQKLIADRDDDDVDGDSDSDGEQDSEEHKVLERLIRLNDLIGDAISAYRDLEQGKEPVFKTKLPESENISSSTAPVDAAENSLIAWDDDGGDDDSKGDANQDQGQQASSSPSATATATAAAKNPIDDLMGLNFESPAPNISAGMLNTPGLTPLVSGIQKQQQRPQPMSNPSLPANSQAARVNKQQAANKKDMFDFSDLMMAAKDTAKPNSPKATNWGTAASVEGAKSSNTQDNTNGSSSNNNNSSLIDFLS